jgi:hypothetical protein
VSVFVGAGSALDPAAVGIMVKAARSTGKIVKTIVDLVAARFDLIYRSGKMLSLFARKISALTKKCHFLW